MCSASLLFCLFLPLSSLKSRTWSEITKQTIWKDLMRNTQPLGACLCKEPCFTNQQLLSIFLVVFANTWKEWTFFGDTGVAFFVFYFMSWEWGLCSGVVFTVSSWGASFPAVSLVLSLPGVWNFRMGLSPWDRLPKGRQENSQGIQSCNAGASDSHNSHVLLVNFRRGGVLREERGRGRRRKRLCCAAFRQVLCLPGWPWPHCIAEDEPQLLILQPAALECLDYDFRHHAWLVLC